MKTRVAVAALTAAATLALTACSGATSGPGAEAEHDLILATITVDTTPQAAAIKWFFNEVNERTDGRINIDMTSPEEICKATETAECVRDGRADIGVALADYTAQLFPAEVIVSIPFLSNSSQQATMNALWQSYKEHEGAQAKWEQIGLKPVAHWPAGRLTIGANHKIEGIEDMKGTSGAYLARTWWKRLNLSTATPYPCPVQKLMRVFSAASLIRSLGLLMAPLTTTSPNSFPNGPTLESGSTTHSECG